MTARLIIIVSMLVGGIAAFGNGYHISGILMHMIPVGYLLAGTLNPSSKLFGPVRTRIENGVWITLDDGPDPADTPAILDLLDKHGAKGTFFVIGEKAEKHPDLIHEIHRRGHQIGNHSYSHPRATFWCLGPQNTYRQIMKCQKVVKAITGQAPVVFRAPVGHYNVFVHPVLKQERMELVGWSSRGFDGVSATLEDVLRRIRTTADEGGIILAHEGTPIAVEVVAGILLLGEKNGWRFVIPDDSPK